MLLALNIIAIGILLGMFLVLFIVVKPTREHIQANENVKETKRIINQKYSNHGYR